ncbi:hypothetical protein [Niastella populi]|uniref:Uncharacterized protein n=1 Tax=Niastella populi TaxID=550983 RepID=A0A1V9FJD7_9BACT|nr:hypothetical protein [Niastella populi]OQP58469.1 hypothetical protein A4R26_03160 [Niastella populi]
MLQVNSVCKDNPKKGKAKSGMQAKAESLKRIQPKAESLKLKANTAASHKRNTADGQQLKTKGKTANCLLIPNKRTYHLKLTT